VSQTQRQLLENIGAISNRGQGRDVSLEALGHLEGHLEKGVGVFKTDKKNEGKGRGRRGGGGRGGGGVLGGVGVAMGCGVG